MEESEKAVIRELLTSKAGQALAAEVSRHRPKIIGKTIEERAMNASEAEGWEKCWEFIHHAVEKIDEIAVDEDGFMKMEDDKPEEPKGQ